MIRFSDPKAAAPIIPIGAVCILAYSIAQASPDGAEWETAAKPEGCQSCHLGAPIAEASSAIAIEGLPAAPEAGQRYELTIKAEDPALTNAGFLLTIEASGDAGTLESLDDRTETLANQARSNWEGSFVTESGKASWRIAWTAPATIATAIELALWVNAGNYDASPLGDRLHHRVFTVGAPP